MENSYRPETKPPHTHVLNIPAVVIAIILVCIAAYGIPDYFLPETTAEQFYRLFAFIPYVFSHDGGLTEWTATITYSFLHGSWTHLGLNMLWLVIFGSPLANRLGIVRFLLFWVFTAVISALTHFWLYPESPAILVGASGAISGLMGAAARYGFQRVPEREAPQRSEFAGPILPIWTAIQSRSVLVFVGSWLLANLFIGFSGLTSEKAAETIAWGAHIGGLLAGFLAIGLFDKRRRDYF